MGHGRWDGVIHRRNVEGVREERRGDYRCERAVSQTHVYFARTFLTLLREPCALGGRIVRHFIAYTRAIEFSFPSFSPSFLFLLLLFLLFVRVQKFDGGNEIFSPPRVRYCFRDISEIVGRR